MSFPDPPRKVDELVFAVVVVVEVVVVVKIRATNASRRPPEVPCGGLFFAGKSEESVNPVTRTFPLKVPLSLTIARPASLALPPR